MTVAPNGTASRSASSTRSRRFIDTGRTIASDSSTVVIRLGSAPGGMTIRAVSDNGIALLMRPIR